MVKIVRFLSNLFLTSPPSGKNPVTVFWSPTMVKFMGGNVPSVVQGGGVGGAPVYTGVNVPSVNLLSLYLNDSLSIAINLCNP